MVGDGGARPSHHRLHEREMRPEVAVLLLLYEVDCSHPTCFVDTCEDELGVSAGKRRSTVKWGRGPKKDGDAFII